MTRYIILACIVALHSTCRYASDPATAGAESKPQSSAASPLPSATDTPRNETETEESDRLLQERQMEDEKLYSELDVYDGSYTLYTESEGVNATLTLKYNGDKTFQFNWKFLVADQCSATASGMVSMDRTQHGFYQGKEGFAHVNFMGSGQMGMIVELAWAERPKSATGDCDFSGTYTSQVAQ